MKKVPTTEADEEKQRSEDAKVSMTALDHFLKGEEARTRVAGAGKPAAGPAQPDRAPRTPAGPVPNVALT